MLLANGMTSGAIVAVIMMVFMELTAPRRRRLEAAMDTETLPKLSEFPQSVRVESRVGTMLRRERLVLVGEETLASLSSDEHGELETGRGRRLVVTARTEGGSAELEFVSASEGENLEDRLAYLGGGAGDTRRQGDIVPPAAPLRVVGAASEVSRRRHRYGESRRAELGTRAVPNPESP